VFCPECAEREFGEARLFVLALCGAGGCRRSGDDLLAHGTSGKHDLVIGTADGKPVAERNLRRALDDAKEAVGLDATEGRLLWHSLRHSFASLLATARPRPRGGGAAAGRPTPSGTR
jgi:hypothetical protein